MADGLTIRLDLKVIIEYLQARNKQCRNKKRDYRLNNL